MATTNLSASFTVTSPLNWSDSSVGDTEMVMSTPKMSSTYTITTDSTVGLSDSEVVTVTPTTTSLSEDFLPTHSTSFPTLTSEFQLESSSFLSPSRSSYFGLDITPSITVDQTEIIDNSTPLYNDSSIYHVYPTSSTISLAQSVLTAVTTTASSSVVPGDTLRTNTTVSNVATSHLIPTPYTPPVLVTTSTPAPSLSSISPHVESTTPGMTGSTSTMNSTGNGTIVGHPPPQASSLPLAVVIALPVCGSVLLILAIAAVLFIIHRRRRQKAGIEPKRTENDKELWLNTGTQLPSLPPSPVSLNGHIVPLTPTDTEITPVKDHEHDVANYEVIHDFEARLDAQLPMSMGQKVTVQEKAENGWWRGRHGDNTGWFPREYVKEIVDPANGTANGEKAKFNQPDQKVDVEETDVSFISHPIKPAVSSFLIRKKGQEDKSPAELLKEDKVRQRNPDQNGNGVLSNSNMVNSNTRSDLPEEDMTNKLNVQKSAEQGSSSESLPVYIGSGIRTEGQRYSTIYPYTAACEGEITLQENDVVVYLEEGSIGWIKARRETSDEEGWVPATYLRQVNSDDTVSQSSLADACHQLQNQLHANKRLSLASEHFVGVEHQALYGYMAQYPEDLSFEAGDVIVVLDALENGWWHGLKGEEFGWFPGSFVEMEGGSESPPRDIHDRDTRLFADSLSSSQDSSQADLLKNLNEELVNRKESDTLSMGSISTTGSDEGKPRPVRKAPAPPGGQISIKQTSRKKRVTRRPSRPAPPPPPPPTGSKGDSSSAGNGPVSLDVPGTVINANGSKDNNSGAHDLDKGETTQQKPPLPRRFVKPKLVKISKKRLKLQNSAALPAAGPSRPVPPRPPAPRPSSVKKYAPKNSKKDKSFDSRNSVSGNLKLKKSDISSPVVLEHTSMKTDNIVVHPVVNEAGSSDSPRAEAVLPDQNPSDTREHSSPTTTMDTKNPRRKRLSSPGPPVAPKPKYHLSPQNTYKTSSSSENNLSPSQADVNGHERTSPVSNRSGSEVPDKHQIQSNFSANPENNGSVAVPKPRRRNSSENELDMPESNSNQNHPNPSRHIHVDHSKQNSSDREGNRHRKHVKQPRPPPPKSPPPSTKPVNYKTSSTDEVQSRPQQRKKCLKKTIHAYTAVGEGELSFEEGSFIKEMEEVADRPGWFVGMLADGTVGTFHQSHVDETTINRHSLA